MTFRGMTEVWEWKGSGGIQSVLNIPSWSSASCGHLSFKHSGLILSWGEGFGVEAMPGLLMRNLRDRTTYDTCWVCFLPFLGTACCSRRFVLEETQGGQREEAPEPQHLLALELLMPSTGRRKLFLEMIIKGSGAASSRAELSFCWQFPCWQVRLCPGGEMFWTRAKD